MSKLQIPRIKEWEEYLKQLWTEDRGNEETIEMDKGRNEVDQIDLSEIQQVLKLSENKESFGTGNLSTALFRYGPHCLIIKFFLTLILETKKKANSNYKTYLQKGDTSKCESDIDINFLTAAYKTHSIVTKLRMNKIMKQCT